MHINEPKADRRYFKFTECWTLHLEVGLVWSGLVTNDRQVVTLYVFLVSLGMNKSGIKPSPGMICVHFFTLQSNCTQSN
jgi:hypothetical protein